MLEGLAAWVLNSYLGQYVENLNTDQLSIGLLKGQVELENLPLKRDALISLDLPIEVKSGFVGKICLRVPLTRLRSEPWVISIEQVYIVAGPTVIDEYDAEREDQTISERKFYKMDMMEAKWRSQHEAQQEVSYYASSYSSWVSYGTSLVSGILDNIQLKIKDVYIRFEDEWTDPMAPVAFGIMLEGLTAQSCNGQWVPQFISKVSAMKYKLVELQNLSIYWDVHPTLLSRMDATDAKEILTSSYLSDKSSDHNYLVKPICAKAQLQKSNSATETLKSRSHPRIICDLLIDTFPVSFSDKQYEGVIRWTHEFNRSLKSRRYERWRPRVPLHGSAHLWWQFAAKPCILEYQHRYNNRNWSYVLQRAKDNVMYVQSYTAHLINPVTCPTALKNFKDTFEQEVPYEEIKLLREVAMEKVSSIELESRKKQATSFSGAGVLLKWFPLWQGWYVANSKSSAESLAQLGELSPAENENSKLEDEILDVLSNIENEKISKQDAVSAKVNFTLKRGTFSLCKSAVEETFNSEVTSKEQPMETLFELEFATMEVGMEFRPKTLSSSFQVCLGSLYLRDKSMAGSLFPSIVEPHQVKEIRKAMLTRQSSLASRFLPRLARFNSCTTDCSSDCQVKNDPLFQLIYEVKPSHSTSDFRLHVKSKSLDIVYNEASIKRLVRFFNAPYKQELFKSHRSLMEMEIGMAAISQYEKLKQQTKQEILKQWDKILDGDENLTKQWDIDLDISAPHIILPEHFFNSDTTIVVCDFGQFLFSTASSKVQAEQKTPSSDDEDDFRTPCSTPPNEMEDVAMEKSSFQPTLPSITEELSQSDITYAAIHRRMYESYSLEFRDMRILVCKASDDWRYSCHQATNPMHLLDRMTVMLLLERRVIYTSDPQWPNVTLSGSLPLLVVHINEEKLRALCLWHSIFTSSTTSWTQPSSLDASNLLASDSCSGLSVASQSPGHLDDIASRSLSKELNADARLLTMQFSVDKLCLDLQSRGQSVAELQVTGIKSQFTLKPFTTLVKLSVDSLLLVDAMQTFGPDFELLVASHKNVSMDSLSGSLLDSEPTSPSSPASPSTSCVSGATAVNISAAVKHLQSFNVKATPPSSVGWTPSVHAFSPAIPALHQLKQDAEALITIDLTVLYPNTELNNETSMRQIATIHFNNLDIIANQKTIVEMLGFVRQMFPNNVAGPEDLAASATDQRRANRSELSREEQGERNDASNHIELNFDFHRLNILFLKSSVIGDTAVAVKVATATVSGACVTATIDSHVKIEGSLGGLQVLDLVPKGSKYSRILTVGYDPLLHRKMSVVESLQEDLYKSSAESTEKSDGDSIEKAFSFVIVNRFGDVHDENVGSRDVIDLTLRMASVHYLHSMRFLSDLTCCASQFSHYMDDLASSFKTAAAEVAGLCSSSFIKLDVILETPVIVLPESPVSSNTLVAHLGHISISNCVDFSVDPSVLPSLHSVVRSEKTSIEIRDMNLVSLNLNENDLFASSSSANQQWISASRKHPDASANHMNGFPILHKTVIVLNVTRTKGYAGFANEDDHSLSSSLHTMSKDVQECLLVCGSVVSPLRVSFSKKQYEQLLRTFDYVTSFDESTSSKVESSLYMSPEESKTESASLKSFINAPTPKSRNERNYLKWHFDVPKLTIVLFGDLAEMERPLVSFTFQVFTVDFEKNAPFVSTTTITLRSLQMEDLLEEQDSKHRFLMMSYLPDAANDGKAGSARTRYLSSSCPDITSPHVSIQSYLSLPDKLNTESIFRNFHRLRDKKLFGGYIHVREPSVQSVSDHCPCTPPPSPLGDKNRSSFDDVNTLVRLKILNVSRKSPEFVTIYNSTNRFVDVTFNCLYTIINHHSWVVILDFFDVGFSRASSSSRETFSKESGSATTRRKSRSAGHHDLVDEGEGAVEAITTEIEVEVCSLSVILKKEEYELAKANVSDVICRVSQQRDYFTVSGKLGSISLLDLSPYGHLYKEKFTTIGSEMLDFWLLKYDGKADLGERDYDAYVKLDMSSVRYVHTNRFSMELVAFFWQFNQLQDIMAKFRADATGEEVEDQGSESSRVKLQIHIGSPIIVVPVSCRSTEVLVANLGQLSMSNEFVEVAVGGTLNSSVNHSNNSFVACSDNGDTTYHSVDSDFAGISEEGITLQDEVRNDLLPSPGSGCSCVVDVGNIQLVDMDLYLAERIEQSQPSKSNDSSSAMQFQTCVFQKKSGALLSEKCRLNLQMERHLHCVFSHHVADVSLRGMLSTVDCKLDLNQYKVIRGILKYNLGERLDELRLPEPVAVQVSHVPKGASSKNWTQLSFHLDLVNVALEVYLDRPVPSSCAQQHKEEPLAKINFFKSKLEYEQYVNGSVDVDLVSQEVLVSDTRFSRLAANARPNVFTKILQPTKRSEANVLQAEIHCRMSPELFRTTMLLNNMQVIVIFDWWLAVFDFIFADIDNFFPGESEQQQLDTGSNATSVPNLKAVTVSEGVVTKRGPLYAYSSSQFELKLNVAETSVVVVEEASMWDSNAVTVKATAVMSHCPNARDKPLSCNVQRLEVFTCILGMEDDTALSIVDPVTVNMELMSRDKYQLDRGLLDSVETHYTFEVSVQDLYLRLSYHDVQLFVRILDSLPKQFSLSNGSSRKTRWFSDGNGADATTDVDERTKWLISQVGALEQLGFRQGDCLRALEACGHKMDDAALWLTQNATPITDGSAVGIWGFGGTGSQFDSLNVTSLHVHVNQICLCLIDDCKDADVPLLEVVVNNASVFQTLCSRANGKAEFTVGCDFYNCGLSGWEPFLEPWKCNLGWEVPEGNASVLSIGMSGDDVVNVNVTSTLLELYRSVKTKWMEDYVQQRDSRVRTACQRTPFVPFALRNDTGCSLKFATATSKLENECGSGGVGSSSSSSSRQSDQWTEVSPGGVVPFTFEGRLKARHQDTHNFNVHQLVVSVSGWQPVSPVSVDKVGVFFRDAVPRQSLSAVPVRIVFAVTQERNAQKLVTVRSALMLTNRLDSDLDVRLENSMLHLGATEIVRVKAQHTVAVPLAYVTSGIFVRPVRSPPVLYSSTSVQWQHVTKSGVTSETSYWCTSTATWPKVTRFSLCARVHRDNFPDESVPPRSRLIPQPAHHIAFHPPVVVVNLLPCDLVYEVQSDDGGRFRQEVGPGQESAIHVLNLSETIRMSLSFDNFQVVNALEVPPGSVGFVAVLEARDVHSRLLLLHVKVTGLACSLRVHVYVPFWLVNKTGLPLIIRQDGMVAEAAGQFSEHEMARSVAPLLFSFADSDDSSPSRCSLRVGRMVHHPDGEPQWCYSFHLHGGVRVRRLYVRSRSHHHRPDWVYSIGIDVRVGMGRYADVSVVTFSPRFQLNNHSSHSLEFAQKFTLDEGRPDDAKLSAMPKCLLPYHWPRLDRDQLLCVRLSEVAGCHWSGGFPIERIDSFHINVRDGHDRPVFLRVDIVCQRSTYFVVFTDADDMPAPLRIDNLSEVPVTCHQSGVVDRDWLRLCVRPHSSVAYAWDEPTLAPEMTCMAPGGCNASYSLAAVGDHKLHLSYENFIYVSFLETFWGRVAAADLSYGGYENQELVLDVPTGCRVLIARKESGQRSQLWRMTSTGMLQHEGSSPPSRKSQVTDHCLVLDIEDIAPSPKEYVRLVLRKPDKRRRVTQTWQFTEDGRLCCKFLPKLFVQPRDGFYGLKSGSEVVLGPPQPVQYEFSKNGVPVEQVLGRQRLWPGSGLLGVRNVLDGPTKVLQIIDMQQKTSVTTSTADDSDTRWRIRNCIEACGGDGTPPMTTTKGTRLQFLVHLPGGIGISVINASPEELVYVRFSNITVDVSLSPSEQKLDGTVQDIQVDNQLANAECPVVLFVSPHNKSEPQNLMPAMHFTIHRVASRHANVDIFKNFMLAVKNVTLQVEERLLWKLFQFVGAYCHRDDADDDDDLERLIDGGTVELQQFRQAAVVALAKRYYFDVLKLKLDQVRLSVITSGGLSPELRAIKQRTGITLIRFEDAFVELDSFVRTNPCETKQFLMNAIVEHYKYELMSQAAKILGAVDFLGNPLGLVNDVSEGLSGFFSDRNVSGLLKNVTHGLSNSAAKVTGTLSEGLGVVTMDDKHQMHRNRLYMEQASGGSGDRLVAGLKGLGFGLYGGVTSLVVQTYEGAANRGLPGLISGFSKGLVGTVTKPAIGMLDFASGAASAVRETSRSNYHVMPPRLRPRRVCVGPGGLLPVYSRSQSEGQELLHAINNRDYAELFIACEPLGYSTDSLYALISSQKVYFLSQSSASAAAECILVVSLRELYHCKVVRDQAASKIFFLELTTQAPAMAAASVRRDQVNRPKFACHTEVIAQKVAQQINYAKRMNEEMIHMLPVQTQSAETC